jgi:hypothetical protein
LSMTYPAGRRVQALREAQKEVTAETRCLVMERSWLSSRHCFAANSRDLGHLDPLEASLHNDLFEWARPATCCCPAAAPRPTGLTPRATQGLASWPRVDGVVFIELETAVAQGRVARRGRTAESEIPLDYQQALAEKHRAWLGAAADVRGFGGPVLTLNGNAEKDDGAVEAMAAQVTKFATELLAGRAEE